MLHMAAGTRHICRWLPPSTSKNKLLVLIYCPFHCPIWTAPAHGTHRWRIPCWTFRYRPVVAIICNMKYMYINKWHGAGCSSSASWFYWHIDKINVTMYSNSVTYFVSSGIDSATPARNSGYRNHDGFSKKAKWWTIVASASLSGCPRKRSCENKKQFRICPANASK